MASASLAADTLKQRWSSDGSRVGLALLKKMGWSEGAGLGAQQHGRTEALYQKSKLTLAGIGADTEENAVALQWHAPAKLVAEFDGVLSNLEAVGASPASSGRASSSAARKEARRARKWQPADVAQKLGALPVSSASYMARRMHGKNVQNYSADSLREIFGGADVSPSLPLSSGSNEPRDQDDESGRKALKGASKTERAISKRRKGDKGDKSSKKSRSKSKGLNAV
ncbi:PIN2/TERF1-interacting telomerase inhibitor 1 [Porphyridium purpureum]|uniref:PIN2/TERF1-interacting telomerase inhibitor 1 n=1 Tax=Porphyridium purpureum TaxID=35688 RepID=A0A5J4Z3Z7_PORPP|nr:PIN2/TERF1-interacting telomerase inhibitor 1 [Porphyridium purpureum]|eukprot:POR1687..scf295_1